MFQYVSREKASIFCHLVEHKLNILTVDITSIVGEEYSCVQFKLDTLGATRYGSV